MSKIFKDFWIEIKQLKYFILAAIIVFSLSYALPLVTKGKSNYEDGFIEYATALILLITGIVYLILYFKTKKLLNIVFVLIFFIGFGEEISWGQRVFEIKTPENVESENFQGEFNIHNLKIFNSKDEDGNLISGINIEVLFTLFCFGYGIILPFICILFNDLKRIANNIGLLIPPISIGLLFILKILITRIFFSASSYAEMRIGESSEVSSVFILLLIGLSFFKLNEFKKPVESEN